MTHKQTKKLLTHNIIRVLNNSWTLTNNKIENELKIGNQQSEDKLCTVPKD